MNVMGLIFASNADMGYLTEKRTMASLPFGGRYRQVDFALSNLTNAGIRHIGIISRHNYQSLMYHIGSGEEWGLELEEGGLEFMTPYATSQTDSYRGKLESLYSCLDSMSYTSNEEYIVLTDTAVLSNIDLTKVIADHVKSGKDITVVAKAGIANGKKTLDLAVDYPASEEYLASMDIFILSKQWLIRQVREHIAHNLYHMDRDLVLGMWKNNAISVNVYQFDGVALFNDTLLEYYRNNLALLDKDVRHDLFNGSHTVYTKVRDRVPTYYGEDCEIENCIVADGCFLEGEVEDSILFRQVTIGKDAEVENCLIMNDSVVGEGCELKYVILDKDVTVRPGAKLIGAPGNPIVVKRGEIV